ncbi:ROK family protein [Haloferula sp.]|uniref:ROK family protein n=1 Tax=Haloferula sp. TaxID=2497595 RepID=UPI003C71E523
MNSAPLHLPELDPQFLAASLWTRNFEALCAENGGRSIVIDLLRPDGTGTSHREILLPDEPRWRMLNRCHLERIVKFLLWGRGGSRLRISGAPELCMELQARYSPRGERAFDADFVQRVFDETLTISDVSEGQDEPQIAAGRGIREDSALKGCRIGFDLGGSDRKCAALIDGKVVFSEEIPWDPYFQKDPSYHYDGIMDSLRRAAAHLPRVDAIGGSAAGVYVNNLVRVASLFRGVPDDLFKEQVEGIFLKVAREWNDVPMCVVNDGDVTALAGSMSLRDGAVLGVAMGTSVAAGYVDGAGEITNWLSELAFVPIDYREHAPADEWSGDLGCAVQYFSQQGVSRLIPRSGLEIDMNLGKPEQLVAVQEFMDAGDERAAAIYRTIGTYLGYAIPHFARFYEIRHLLLLGRVLSGKGGEWIIDKANTVLQDEFPRQAATLQISTPDEKLKRHGQAIAAASLPRIP